MKGMLLGMSKEAKMNMCAACKEQDIKGRYVSAHSNQILIVRLHSGL